ncbi:multicopper oxidase-domain-containing protein [Amylocarpus encephaloides]|uniref:Multicopper oxidase-domain-containing protein n=1 Tax=Amylocarpus encephaloides TaxID=45428 RepID=A0A9P7YB14_9HELO|nr:multicopper oxidase-domain-containing protein [Amylocarpus encephaloides]
MVSLQDRLGDDIENVEMEEIDDHGEGEGQEDRLLPGQDGDLEGAGDQEYKVEFHLRTIWVVLGSILAAGLVYAALVAFTKTFIVKDHLLEESVEMKGVGGFRRPASDYILDPTWDFDAPNKIRHYKWTVTDIVANPDGVFRPMLTINGLFPGPMIECNDGDNIVIDVDNQSVNATAIHFHGLFQNGTNWMDGTIGVTQCPIAPRKKFQYKFTVTGQSGTYYYHSHQAVTASDGLYGPLVIHDRREKDMQRMVEFEYASDRVVMLQDYYHDLSSGLLKSTLEPGSESSPIPDGALINGLNCQDCSQLPTRLCDNSTCASPELDLTSNANHRLRIINVGAFAWFQVSVDEHQFAITEVDGTEILPSYDTRLMISPAQRYSIVVTTNQTKADSFWFRARLATHCFNEPQLAVPGTEEVKAAIYYTPMGPRRDTTVVRSQPTPRDWSPGMEVECRDMNTTVYTPSHYMPAPAVADHSYYLRSNLEIGDWRLERGFFNTSTFRPNLQQPSLHRTVDGLSSGNETFTATSKVDGVNSVAYDLKNEFSIQHTGIKVVDVVVQNYDEGNHPMHLHGHKFWVLGQGHGMFPGYESLNLLPEGKGVAEGHEDILDSVIRRDVATAEGFGWLVLRFIADNSGVWNFHCHMAWHSEAGLSLNFLSRVDEIAKWEIPEANRQLCASSVEELEKGSTPKDSQWFGFGIGD